MGIISFGVNLEWHKGGEAGAQEMRNDDDVMTSEKGIDGYVRDIRTQCTQTATAAFCRAAAAYLLRIFRAGISIRDNTSSLYDQHICL